MGLKNSLPAQPCERQRLAESLEPAFAKLEGWLAGQINTLSTLPAELREKPLPRVTWTLSCMGPFLRCDPGGKRGRLTGPLSGWIWRLASASELGLEEQFFPLLEGVRRLWNEVCSLLFQLVSH